MSEPNIIERLYASAQELNKASDLMRDQVILIEGAIKATNAGVSAWIDANPGSVGYAKVKGVWGLYIDTSTPGFYVKEIQPFNSASRSDRIRCIHLIPELVEKLVLEATELTKTMEISIETARTIADAMKVVLSDPQC